MITQTINYATKEMIIRERIKLYRPWIEAELCIFTSEAMVLEVGFPLAQLAVPETLSYTNKHHEDAEKIQRIEQVVRAIRIPLDSVPGVGAKLVSSADFKLASDTKPDDRYSLKWLDCPVSIEIAGLGTIVALNVEYHDSTIGEDKVAHVVVLNRACVGAFLDLLGDRGGVYTKSKLHTPRSYPRTIAHCGWDQLVLDPDVTTLLKNDFESLFERHEWFKKMRLPFRRGYLLHGPPGNGKSTAIRAMLTSRGLSAHTLHLFDSSTDDGDLDALFARAEQNRPSVVLLEDLDRAFPKTGETKSKVSLQQLLNCLDGVGTSEGIIVIATANEPTILDPAILRRPGRFDRVVYFGNPNADLRRDYFLRMQPSLRAEELGEVVVCSDGFSFAFLRETYILAGQRAFEECRDIDFKDLEIAVELLRETLRQTSRQAVQPGFKGSLVAGVGK